MFLELYKFIFSDFWVFIGTVILIIAVRGLFAKLWDAAVKLIKEANKGGN